MKIAIKFGFSNKKDNFYEFEQVKNMKIVNKDGEKYFTFTYFGKAMGTRNRAMFPHHNTGIIIRSVVDDE